MAFRFICLDSDNFKLFGTNDETIAREHAEDELVYDTVTQKSLNTHNDGKDTDLEELPGDPGGDDEPEHDALEGED